MEQQYLQNLLIANTPSTGMYSPAAQAINIITPTINAWGNGHIDMLNLSGSYAKGTAVQGGTDVDLFISISSNLNMTMKDIYYSLLKYMKGSGYPTARAQNVSVGINVNGVKVDLVPAKRQNTHNDDHSLFKRKADTWTKTNVQTHIRTVSQSGCLSEIRLMKLWRNQKGLDLSSFYLELLIINALNNNYSSSLPDNTAQVLKYLRDNITTARIVDPANTNNIISDDLTLQEKTLISQAASRALSGSWGQFIS